VPRLFAVLLLAFAWTAGAADVVLPSPGKAVGVVRSDEAGKWIVLSSKMFPVAPVILDDGKACFFEGEPGTYAVIKIPAGDGQPSVNTITLGTPAPPSPPPGPSPPNPPPVPPTPQPVAGPRVVVLLHESLVQSPATGNLIRDMRQGPAEKYLRDKGHRFLALDESNGAFRSWRDAAGLLERPVLMISDPETNRMLYRATLAPQDTADGIIELIKRHGG
jgi:hypothetical protein